MKIVLLHYTAPPIVGGVETILRHQAQMLTRAGHHVRILAGRGQTWEAHIPVDILNLVDPRHPQILRAKASLDGGTVPEGFESQVRQFETELRRALAGAQVVIAHNVASINKNLALTAALHNISQDSPSPRLVLWHHDLAWTTERYLPELHNGWPWDLLRTPWPNVRQVTVSEARRQELAGLMGIPLRQVMLVQAGLDLTTFIGLPKRLASLVDELGLALSAPVLISPVRINRRKNLELALEALAELRKRMPRASLVVTGQVSGQGQDYLVQLQSLRKDLGLESCAHFLVERLPDGLTEASLIAMYRLADALLITSREEGFGMPLLEAGLVGLPVFCTRLPSLQSLAGENAVFFDPSDSGKQVANLIAARLQSNAVYRMRVRVRHDFTWEAIYRKQIEPLLSF